MSLNKYVKHAPDLEESRDTPYNRLAAQKWGWSPEQYSEFCRLEQKCVCIETQEQYENFWRELSWGELGDFMDELLNFPGNLPTEGLFKYSKVRDYCELVYDTTSDGYPFLVYQELLLSTAEEIARRIKPYTQDTYYGS